jgi:hypothetical protein
VALGAEEAIQPGLARHATLVGLGRRTSGVSSSGIMVLPPLTPSARAPHKPLSPGGAPCLTKGLTTRDKQQAALGEWSQPVSSLPRPGRGGEGFFFPWANLDLLTICCSASRDLPVRSPASSGAMSEVDCPGEGPGSTGGGVGDGDDGSYGGLIICGRVMTMRDRQNLLSFEEAVVVTGATIAFVGSQRDALEFIKRQGIYLRMNPLI